MDDADLELLLDDLDDVVFEPSAWDFAVSMGVQLDAEQDPPVLDEALADAARCSPVEWLGTLERWAAIRTRLGRLGEFATESMPDLAVEMKALAAERLPERPELTMCGRRHARASWPTWGGPI